MARYNVNGGIPSRLKQRRLLIVVLAIIVVGLIVLLLPIYHPHQDFTGRDVHGHFIWDFRHVH